MTLEEKIRRLPPEKREVVEQLVDILLEDVKSGKKTFSELGRKGRKTRARWRLLAEQDHGVVELY